MSNYNIITHSSFHLSQNQKNFLKISILNDVHTLYYYLLQAFLCQIVYFPSILLFFPHIMVTCHCDKYDKVSVSSRVVAPTLT